MPIELLTQTGHSEVSLNLNGGLCHSYINLEGFYDLLQLYDAHLHNNIVSQVLFKLGVL